MQTNWSQALKASISEVFSTSFFMVPETFQDAPEAVLAQKASGWFEGHLDFTKEGVGLRIWVWTPDAVAAELAANIFACDVDEVDLEQVLDAYREMINMVSGNLLTMVDKESNWRMGLPTASKLAQGTMAEVVGAAQGKMIFDVEGSPIITGYRAFDGK